MSNQIKDGKKPLSQKPKQAPSFAAPGIGDKLYVQDTLKQALKDKGLEYRYIDVNKYNQSNYHENGWVPYKLEQSDIDIMKDSRGGFLGGVSPEGYWRRQSVVLAVRPIEFGDTHRQILEQKRERFQNVNRQKAEEIRRMAKDARLDSKILEGYEDNE